MVRNRIGGISAGYGLLLLLISLGAMNFCAKFFYFVFATTGATILVFQREKVDGAFLLYLFLGMLMMLYNFQNGIMAMIRCMAFPMMYYVGYSITSQSICEYRGHPEYSKSVQNRIYGVFAAISFGSFAHYMLNYFANMGKDIGRNTVDIWSGEIMSATGQSTLACIMTGFAVAMVLAPRKEVFRYVGAVALVGIFLYNLILSGRTLIAMFLVLFAAGYVFMLKITKQKSKKRKILGWLAFALLCVAVIWLLNLFGIRDRVMSSNLYLRFSGASISDLANSSRGDKKLNFLKNLKDYPFGGCNMRRRYGYAHDLLLDGYDEYGALAAVLLILILANGIKRFMRCCMDNTKERFFRLTVLCVYIAMLLVFCLEPILVGEQWLLACFCLTNGLLSRNDAVAGSEYSCATVNMRTKG